MIRKYKWYGITIVAILVMLFMHLYKLTEVPYGLNVDEASGAYDALNIARYGVDRYLKSYPVYFTNYGDGQNALYIYLTALLIKLFGMSKLIIRATAAIAAVAAAYFGWQYMKGEEPKRQGKVIWLLLYAALPVFIMTQRFGLESHLLLPMSMVSLFFTAKALDTGRWKFYFAAGIVLGVTLYTYALTYIVIPVFLLLILVYSIVIKKFDWKKMGTMLAILAVFATPLILVQVINFFDLSEMRIGPFTFTKLLDYRVDEVAGVSVLQNIKSIFVNTFLYDDLPYNTLSKFGTMFYLSIPFILLGIVKSVYEGIVSLKGKVFSYSVPMVLWLVAEWIMGAFLSGHSVPNSTRMIGVFMPMLYFLVKGLYCAWDLIKYAMGRKIFTVAMTTCYSVSFLFFAVYYFTDYNEEAFPMKWLFYESYDEVGEFLEENVDASWYDRPIAYPWNYIYYVLEYQVNPYEFNLPVNGKERFGKDYVNEFPQETLLESNYVIYKTDQGSKDFLTLVGYEEIQIGESFSFFVSPLDSYRQNVGSRVSVTLDRMEVKGEQIDFVGWCVDDVNQGPFGAIMAETDQGEYTVEILERQDVATHLGLSGDAHYGFRISLPIDILEKADYIKIIGVRDDDSQEEILSFEKK